MKWDLKSIVTLVVVIPWVLVESFKSFMTLDVTIALSQAALMVIAFFYGAKSKSDNNNNSGGDKNGSN